MIVEGSVRADLVGGTLDLFPLNFQIPNVVTINLALSLKAQVEIKKTDSTKVIINSVDYQNRFEFDRSDFTKEALFFSDKFGKMTFVAQILDHCGMNQGVEISLRSGAPAGSGLGGSSSMGVTLYKAIKLFQKESFDPIQAIKEVQQLEAGILRAGVAGYQDYYPAMFGGVLALHPQIGSERIEQLLTDDLKTYLESHMSLVFSGVSRDSGINNWEVYKRFYDKDPHVEKGLSKIANISKQAYDTIKKQNYEKLLRLIIEEGEARRELFPNILGEEISSLRSELLEKKLIQGIKICGAGGGGCFLIIHGKNSQSQNEQINQLISKHGMRKLDFFIEGPIQ